MLHLVILLYLVILLHLVVSTDNQTVYVNVFIPDTLHLGGQSSFNTSSMPTKTEIHAFICFKIHRRLCVITSNEFVHDIYLIKLYTFLKTF